MAFDIYNDRSQDTITLSELDMYHQLMRVRAENGKAALPLSKGLSATAGRHVADVAFNIGYYDVGVANEKAMHKWSDADYDARDQSTLTSMLDAPSRIRSGYGDLGYEIIAYSDEPVRAWVTSPGHFMAINWESHQTIGVGIMAVPTDFYAQWPETIYGGYGPTFEMQAAWFGDVLDPSGPPDIVGTSGTDSVTLTGFADRFLAGAGNDTAVGGTGADVVYGNQGADVIYGNQDADFLFGGQGADRLFGGQADDAVYGNMDADAIYGNFGNDSLFGGQGDDKLFGGQGDDWLNGNLGNDTLIGNLGADTFVFRAGGGTDLVADFRPDQGDRINLATGASYTLTTDNSGAVKLVLASGDSLTLGGVVPAAFDGGWVTWN